MTTTLAVPQLSQSQVSDDAIKQTITTMIDGLIGSLPDPKMLDAEARRGIVARYSAVLESNFIYWMTATLLAVREEEARPILLDNLHEEVRDAHPVMLRRFAIAAHAFPTHPDSPAIPDEPTNLRQSVRTSSAA